LSQSDADAQFYSDRHYDVSQLEPVVAKLSPDNRALARECRDVKLTGFILALALAVEDFVHAANS